MSSRIAPGPVPSDVTVREAVCVHTSKIYDSCKDKDCLRDMRVYLTANSQANLDNGLNVRARSAELLWASPMVEPVTFSRGYYTVDIRFYYKIRADVCMSSGLIAPIEGLASFTKRVLLFGSEGSAKIFTSDIGGSCVDRNVIDGTNLPRAVVEAVDPIILSLDAVDSCAEDTPEPLELPPYILDMFDSPIVSGGAGRQILATLGQFTIVRLERDSQLLIPVYDYCVPEKECRGAQSDDPCTLFNRIDFPVNEFFPPDSLCEPQEYEDLLPETE